MKITIDIPKEFEKHFGEDRFKDSLERIKADLNDEFVFAGLYERELLEMLIEAFNNTEPTFKHEGCCICGADKKMFQLKCANTKQTLYICWNCAKDIAEQHFSEQNVKYGRWIWVKNYRDCEGDIYSQYKCSCCNFCVGGIYPAEDLMHFCGNCGARMEGGEHE